MDFTHFRTFLLFALFTTIDVVLQLYSDLPFRRLVPYKRMLEELFRVRSLMVILHQHRLDKSVKLLRPLLRFEPRRRIAGNQEQGLI